MGYLSVLRCGRERQGRRHEYREQNPRTLSHKYLQAIPPSGYTLQNGSRLGRRPLDYIVMRYTLQLHYSLKGNRPRHLAHHHIRKHFAAVEADAGPGRARNSPRKRRIDSRMIQRSRATRPRPASMEYWEGR